MQRLTSLTSIAKIEVVAFSFGYSQLLESQSGSYSTIRNCLTTYSKPDLRNILDVHFDSDHCSFQYEIYLTIRSQHTHLHNSEVSTITICQSSHVTQLWYQAD